MRLVGGGGIGSLQRRALLREDGEVVSWVECFIGVLHGSLGGCGR